MVCISRRVLYGHQLICYSPLDYNNCALSASLKIDEEEDGRLLVRGEWSVRLAEATTRRPFTFAGRANRGEYCKTCTINLNYAPLLTIGRFSDECCRAQ